MEVTSSSRWGPRSSCSWSCGAGGHAQESRHGLTAFLDVVLRGLALAECGRRRGRRGGCRASPADLAVGWQVRRDRRGGARPGGGFRPRSATASAPRIRTGASRGPTRSSPRHLRNPRIEIDVPPGVLVPCVERQGWSPRCPRSSGTVTPRSAALPASRTHQRPGRGASRSPSAASRCTRGCATGTRYIGDVMRIPVPDSPVPGYPVPGRMRKPSSARRRSSICTSRSSTRPRRTSCGVGGCFPPGSARRGSGCWSPPGDRSSWCTASSAGITPGSRAPSGCCTACACRRSSTAPSSPAPRSESSRRSTSPRSSW